MKQFTINCDFGGKMSPFTIYIGAPEPKHHPIHFQADWLSKERGGTVPPEVMDSLQKLKELADKNNVPLEELCVYALGSTANEGKSPDDFAEVEDDWEEDEDELEDEELEEENWEEEEDELDDETLDNEEDLEDNNPQEEDEEVKKLDKPKKTKKES